MIRYLAALTLLATPCLAEEPVSFDVVLGGGAMICDHAESVVTSLQTGRFMPDCGTFQTMTGAPATVTIIGQYEDKPLAMFEFHNPTPWGNQTQYGWWAGDLPDIVPQGTSL